MTSVIRVRIQRLMQQCHFRAWILHLHTRHIYEPAIPKTELPCDEVVVVDQSRTDRMPFPAWVSLWIEGTYSWIWAWNMYLELGYLLLKSIGRLLQDTSTRYGWIFQCDVYSYFYSYCLAAWCRGGWNDLRHIQKHRTAWGCVIDVWSSRCCWWERSLPASYEWKLVQVQMRTWLSSVLTASCGRSWSRSFLESRDLSLNNIVLCTQVCAMN